MKRSKIRINYRRMWRGIFCFLFVILFAVWQTAVCPRFRLFGAVPDITLGLLVCLAAVEGEYLTSALAVTAGFILESLGGGGISYMPVFFLAAVCFTFWFTQKVLGKKWWMILVDGAIVFAADALIAACLVTFRFSGTNFFAALLYTSLPQLFYSELCLLLIYGFVRVYDWIFREHHRRAGRRRR